MHQFPCYSTVTANQMALKNFLGKRRSDMMTFENIPSITTPTDAGCRATLQTSFSPMSEQSKQRCFEGWITDGEATLRFVSFTQQQAWISKIAADNPISISECSIHKSRSGGDNA